MPAERVVIEVQLGVERQDAAVGGRHQAVGPRQRAIPGEIEREEPLDQRHALLEGLAGQAQAEGQTAGLEIGESESRMRPFTQDLLGAVRGDFFDLHPASLGSHHDVGGAGAVQRDREVQLAVDVRRFFDEHLAHEDALGRCLWSLEPHAKDLAADRFGLSRRGGELDAAGLAPAAGVYLSLDDDTAPDALRCRPARRRLISDVTLRYRDPELAEESFGLVLVNLHAGCLRLLRNFLSSQTMGSKLSAMRSFMGMMPLSVMWMCSGHTSVQHLVMLHSPIPAWAPTNSERSTVSSGCMSRPAILMKKRGPAN